MEESFPLRRVEKTRDGAAEVSPCVGHIAAGGGRKHLAEALKRIEAVDHKETERFEGGMILFNECTTRV